MNEFLSSVLGKGNGRWLLCVGRVEDMEGVARAWGLSRSWWKEVCLSQSRAQGAPRASGRHSSVKVRQ